MGQTTATYVKAQSGITLDLLCLCLYAQITADHANNQSRGFVETAM